MLDNFLVITIHIYSKYIDTYCVQIRQYMNMTVQIHIHDKYCNVRYVEELALHVLYASKRKQKARSIMFYVLTISIYTICTMQNIDNSRWYASLQLVTARIQTKHCVQYYHSHRYMCALFRTRNANSLRIAWV